MGNISLKINKLISRRSKCLQSVIIIGVPLNNIHTVQAWYFVLEGAIFPWQRAPLWGICKFILGLLKGHQGKDQGQWRQLPPWSIRPAHENMFVNFLWLNATAENFLFKAKETPDTKLVLGKPVKTKNILGTQLGTLAHTKWALESPWAAVPEPHKICAHKAFRAPWPKPLQHYWACMSPYMSNPFTFAPVASKHKPIQRQWRSNPMLGPMLDYY